MFNWLKKDRHTTDITPSTSKWIPLELIVQEVHPPSQLIVKVREMLIEIEEDFMFVANKKM
ncbi:hypothetical protein ACIQD3_09500 [Peribacillus loiseleuriae]|uniref:hypothetical protein n=1 Tax=Peribacillus loiseleuriae TaxID=1679170 RepID=UPI0037FADC76